jgi:hypothetical protein
MFGCLVWVGQTGFVDATPSSLYKGHRYPVEIISHCVWLYHRFPLSLREIEELMRARGVLVTTERAMRRFRSASGAQRFLSAFSGISPLSDPVATDSPQPSTDTR